jgi:hypothetical protein
VIREASYQSAEDATPVNGLLRWLSRIDNRDWEPVAIRLYVRSQSNPTALRRSLAALERLASVLMVARADINERINRFAPILKAMAEGDPSPDALVSMLGPSEPELQRALSVVDGPLYENAKVRAYVLLRIDGLLSGATSPHPRDNPTVEHVLPQNPEAGSEWLTWWPEIQERAAWVHKLGNLILLTQRKNSQVGRSSFDEKKKRYFQTKGGVVDFPIATKVLQEATWTQDVVARRQRELLTLLHRHWSGG